MKKSLYLLVVILLGGCNEKGETRKPFEWAVVNESKIQNDVYRRVMLVNPYPQDIAMESSSLRKEQNRLSTLVRKIRSDLRRGCALSSEADSTKRDKTSGTTSSSGSGALRYPGTRFGGRGAYDENCLKKVESDSLLKDMMEKKKELDGIYKKQQEHAKKVREVAKRYTNTLIADYANSKYEIVVGGSGRTVLYNPNGLTLDITDALLMLIDDSRLTISTEMQ